MLTVELETRTIPSVYDRFAKEIGEQHWYMRVEALEGEIRGNPLLKRLRLRENMIAFQLCRLGQLHQQVRPHRRAGI